MFFIDNNTDYSRPYSYRLGARNCKTHFSQVRKEIPPIRGIHSTYRHSCWSRRKSYIDCPRGIIGPGIGGPGTVLENGIGFRPGIGCGPACKAPAPTGPEP